MRNWLLFLCICLSCSSKEESQEQTDTYEAPENEEWITYEGVVRSEEGNDVRIQLSLLQNSVGMESEFKTEEEYISSQSDRLLTNRNGKYSILYGSGSDMVVTLHESKGHSLGWEPGSGYSINPKRPTEKIMASANLGTLAFKTGRNSNELVLLDEHSNPVSNDGRYTLKKRSILFTVEGFVTIGQSGSEFFEFNTRENWNVSRSGAYTEVASRYIELATEKYEGIYLKGIGFYVEDIDSVGAEVKNLVIKRIIRMESHQQFTSQASD